MSFDVWMSDVWAVRPLQPPCPSQPPILASQEQLVLRGLIKLTPEYDDHQQQQRDVPDALLSVVACRAVELCWLLVKATSSAAVGPPVLKLQKCGYRFIGAASWSAAVGAPVQK